MTATDRRERGQGNEDLADEGVQPEMIIDLMGYESFETTLRYAQPEQEDLAAAVDRRASGVASNAARPTIAGRIAAAIGHHASALENRSRRGPSRVIASRPRSPSRVWR